MIINRIGRHELIAQSFRSTCRSTGLLDIYRQSWRLRARMQGSTYARTHTDLRRSIAFCWQHWPRLQTDSNEASLDPWHRQQLDPSWVLCEPEADRCFWHIDGKNCEAIERLPVSGVTFRLFRRRGADCDEANRWPPCTRRRSFLPAEFQRRQIDWLTD